MISQRLPARPLMRCLLAFCLTVCILVPAGLIVLLLKLRADLNSPALTDETFHRPAIEAAKPDESDVSQQSPLSERESALFSSQIVEVVANSQQQSAEKNLRQLDSMSKQLNTVASDQSVDDMANSIQRWMGLESREFKPKAETTITKFDIDSAQLHDVERVERKTGKLEYKAVLIDAQGRTLEIKMTEAEGKDTYVLMQRIKANPLLERVYRRIAMPLLDSLVQSARNQMMESSPPNSAP